jgi:hypothetical protein
VFVSRLYARSSRKRANAPGLLRDGGDQEVIGRDPGLLAGEHLGPAHRADMALVVDLPRALAAPRAAYSLIEGKGVAAVGALAIPLARSGARR